MINKEYIYLVFVSLFCLFINLFILILTLFFQPVFNMPSLVFHVFVVSSVFFSLLLLLLEICKVSKNVYMLI